MQGIPPYHEFPKRPDVADGIISASQCPRKAKLERKKKKETIVSQSKKGSVFEVPNHTSKAPASLQSVQLNDLWLRYRRPCLGPFGWRLPVFCIIFLVIISLLFLGFPHSVSPNINGLGIEFALSLEALANVFHKLINSKTIRASIPVAKRTLPLVNQRRLRSPFGAAIANAACIASPVRGTPRLGRSGL
ncbi:MIZ/SP-RING zinc finger [Colletotrichum scovillei]|uniref:MIZ/SP-RING zinc finger n=1 Tax=Colletotrichum scovillei TaxID=1209932 RepID=A0A9P7UH34_9PEZI|nr:MIZ/SP-RING zinc finger [Colletotrichum scovillei]KAG7074944.1 MIZ/SP-RING zinc finger [Colletotrichum scovillei]KAG7082011.1 MIZ/SP-RING zinc finger [Colletotrichum scovillei]